MEKKDRRMTESEKVRKSEMNEEQKLQKNFHARRDNCKKYEDNVQFEKNRAMQQYYNCR
jgi:ribosomal protein S30